jgi:hypothetical protein
VLAPSKDYTDRDFSSLRLRLISLIQSIPEFADWTDFQDSDPGNILLSAFCFVGDVLGFNLDAAAREAKWGTATQRRSLIQLAKQIAYRPNGAGAATATEVISATDLAANCTIPAGTIIKTNGNPSVDFQVLETEILTPASPSVETDVEHSKTITETPEATSDAWQTIALGQSPYLDDSISISTSQGSWSRVDHFLASGATSRHFTLDVNANGEGVVTFGDGSTGVKPTGTITCVYKTGGGVDGETAAGTITEVQGTFYDALGNRVELTATNPSKSVGAGPPETVASIKVRAPAAIRAGDRTVSREDYETRARGASGVARCLMLTRNQDSAVDINAGMLWVVPNGLGFLTPTIRDAIAAEYVKYQYAPTMVLDIMDPWYLDVSMSVKVYISGTAKKSVVKTAILANLAAWFALTSTDEAGDTIDNPNINFGYYVQDSEGTPTGFLAYSDLFNVVRDTTGVRRIGGNPEDFLLSSAITNTQGTTPLETSVHKDLVLNQRYFPRLSTVTLIDGDTGSAL